MVKIRLARAGAKKHPFYRIVAIDQRAQRDGRPLEFLGTYNPLGDAAQITIQSDRLEAWLSRGAQMTDAVRALVRRAGRAPAPLESAPVPSQGSPSQAAEPAAEG